MRFAFFSFPIGKNISNETIVRFYKRPTVKIDELVKLVLKEQGLDVKLKELELIKTWEKVIGKNVANATTNLYVKNRKLFVHVRSSCVCMCAPSFFS